MRKTIWKIELEVVSYQTLEIPAGAEILSAQMQREAPCIWYLCNPENDAAILDVWILGTGHPHDDTNGEFVDTFQMDDGRLVFHVFAAVRSE